MQVRTQFPEIYILSLPLLQVSSYNRAVDWLTATYTVICICAASFVPWSLQSHAAEEKQLLHPRDLEQRHKCMEKGSWSSVFGKSSDGMSKQAAVPCTHCDPCSFFFFKAGSSEIPVSIRSLLGEREGLHLAPEEGLEPGRTQAFAK